MQDAIACQVNAVISNKAVPISRQAGPLLNSIGSFKVFIHYCCNWVDRGKNISGCGFFE